MSIIDLLQAEPSKLGFDPTELKAKYLAERDRRIRIDGNDQYTEIVDEFARYDDDPYTEAEQEWIDEMRDKARLGARFYAECTPGYYNNEGKPGENPVGFFSGAYGAGPIKFFRILDEWRENGRLAGLVLD